ncbi:MAG: helix-turn-helix domain-containing protein [Blautia sp.]|nr:helix-turn-helix domain-containing protein [Blautia sp.]
MDTVDFKRISKKLKELRISKGLTQEYVANMADVNTSHISNIENNRVKVSLNTLVQICNALDTTVDYVLSDEYLNSSSALDQNILNELQKCNKDTKERILKIIQILQ